MNRIIVLALVAVVIFAGCRGAQTPDADTDGGPYVKTSYSYGATGKRASSTKPSAPLNSVTIGDSVYVVSETTQGFSVQALNAHDQSLISRENYTLTDTSILALSSPSIHDVSGGSFVVTFRATTKTGTSSPSFTVTTSPIRITAR